MASRRTPDDRRTTRMLAAAEEAEDVLKTADHVTYAKAAGLRNAVAAGLAPPPAFVAAVRAALEVALKAAAESTGEATGEPTGPEGIDSGTTRATKSTLRGVLKRFEDAFGAPAKPAARGRREK